MLLLRISLLPDLCAKYGLDITDTTEKLRAINLPVVKIEVEYCTTPTTIGFAHSADTVTVETLRSFFIAPLELAMFVPSTSLLFESVGNEESGARHFRGDEGSERMFFPCTYKVFEPFSAIIIGLLKKKYPQLWTPGVDAFKLYGFCLGVTLAPALMTHAQT